MIDLNVRGRLPDRYRPAFDTAATIVETVVGVLLNAVLFVIMAAVPFGVLTGDLSVSSAATVYGVMIGSMLLTYAVVEFLDGYLEPAAFVWLFIQIAAFSSFGVGIAVLPEIGAAILYVGGLTLAVLSYVRAEWFMARLGFGSTDSDREVAA